MAVQRGMALLAPLIALLLASCAGGAPAAGVMRQAYHVGDGDRPGFALDYPSGWRHQDTEAGLMLSDDHQLLAADDDGVVIPSGSLAVNVSLLTAADVRALGARNAASLIDALVGTSENDALSPQYRSIEAIAIDGRQGARSQVSIPDSDSLLLALELEGSYVLAIVVTPRGELQRHDETLNAIFASVRLLSAN